MRVPSGPRVLSRRERSSNVERLGLLRLGLESRVLSLEPVEDELRVLAEMEKERHEVDGRLEVLWPRHEHRKHVAPEVPCRPSPEPEPPDHGTEGADLCPAPSCRPELLGLASESTSKPSH